MGGSVPYWGSNYLIRAYAWQVGQQEVSVPYWGSNYLILLNLVEKMRSWMFPSPTGVLII